ncbi:MAG: S-layer homology domain-containing protein [Clostridia bacterium]|nr:S-layer homology domain-containing protein [Clostridia bacterium]
MKKKLLKRVCACALAGGLLVASSALPASAATAIPTVSYGLSVLAAQTDMAVMAPVGNEIAFSKEVFARALNLSNVRYVTVCSLPAATDGELVLGSTRVAAGQTVSADNLAYMTFRAANDEVPLHSSFTFTANGSANPIVCNLYLLDRGNYTPTVSVASSLSLNVSTYKELCAYGTLSAYDPDGDALCFEIVSYPENGAVRLTDKNYGTYVYTPQAGYIGTDSFSYVARDKYGNYSAAATVNLNVELSGTSVTYEDMKEREEYRSALALTEAGIMSGKQVGNLYYFYPEEQVSRVEFLVMAMNAVGINDVPDCAQTVFADDASIPPTMKGYVSAAYELGYINGIERDGALCFAPNEPLTRAHAAVILEKLVGLDKFAVTPTFADAADIPTWASEAIYSLSAAGILSSVDGCVSPTASLTRAQTAHLLANTMEYVNR